jgi:hypothetical protein
MKKPRDTMVYSKSVIAKGKICEEEEKDLKRARNKEKKNIARIHFQDDSAMFAWS